MDNTTYKVAEIPVVAHELYNGGAAEQVQIAMGILAQRVDLAGSALYSKALLRKRIIQTAQDLLRVVMVYSLTDLSLRMVGLWATVMGWGSLSKSGVRKRLQQCQAWIGVLIVSVLMAGQLHVPRCGKYRFRVFDVTNVSQPGSHKIDWRLHLDFALNRLGIEGVQLTTGAQGETLTRWQFAPNDLVLADRIYGVARSLGVLLGAAAYFVIRIGWQNLPVTDRDAHPFSIPNWLKVQSRDPAAPPAQTQVWVKTPQGRFPLRLIARALPADKAEQKRRHLQAEAKHKHRRLDERSLLAAGFLIVVSNLPEREWTAADLLALYRFRWQIELVFKRLKSLLCFDHLRAKDPHLAQTYLLTKILIALLLGEAEWRLALAAPDTFADPDRPVSRWHLMQLVLAAFRQTMCGSLTWDKIIAHLPELSRYLCDEPRRRKRQLDALRNLGIVCGC